MFIPLCQGRLFKTLVGTGVNACYQHTRMSFNPLPHNKVLAWSKLKQIEDDIFKFDENSRQFSKRVENTVGKGEIARYEQFLLFPQCFQKACFLEASKGVIVWEWVKDPKKSNLKTLWQKEKTLVTCILSFSGNIFCPLNHINFAVSKCFEIRQIQNFIVHIEIFLVWLWVRE